MGINFTKNSIVSQGGRFGFLSVASFLLTLTGSVVGHEILVWPEEVAYLVSLVMVFFVNFIGMRYYVYPGSGSKNIAKQLLGFIAASIGFRSAEFLLFLIFHTWLNLQYLIAIIMIMVISFIGKFIFYRLAIFN